jgi:hypothetical protein
MRNSYQQIVCVGNSHLASFSKTIKSTLPTNDVSMKFWPVEYMANRWDDFKANRFLNAPEFKAQNPAGLPRKDTALKNKSILVLVGIGLSGNHLFTQFGDLLYANPAELPNGYSKSPLMPSVYGNNINQTAALTHMSSREAPCYPVSMCKRMFANSIDIFLNKLHYLVSNSRFIQVYCVPAPNMPDRVARWRLGEDYCESGCQRVLNDVYRQTLTEIISKKGISENIIMHDLDYENHLGFIYDKYADSTALNDNHVNPAYYEHTVIQLLERIKKLW